MYAEDSSSVTNGRIRPASSVRRAFAKPSKKARTAPSGVATSGVDDDLDGAGVVGVGLPSDVDGAEPPRIAIVPATTGDNHDTREGGHQEPVTVRDSHLLSVFAAAEPETVIVTTGLIPAISRRGARTGAAIRMLTVGATTT